MIKTSITLQELRRKIYIRAKADKAHRFWGLYVHVCKQSTLEEAYQMVKRNNGAPGIDGMTFEDIEQAGVENFLRGIQEQLINGSYQPTRNRIKEIPKANGKTRKLGIPTIRDRVVQGAVKLIIEPVFESDFQEGSYGYRPKKTAHQVIERVADAVVKEKTRVIDLDLKSYFDTVKHHILLDKVAKRISDDKIMRLLKQMLKAGGKEGVPQGGVIALRTHSQTLSFSGGWKLKEVSFNIFIKSITFMINGKSTELRIGQTHQPGVYLVAKQQASAAYSRKADAEVWRISGTGLPLYTVGPGDQRENGDTGKFCGVYSKASTYTDQPDKETIGIQRAIDQQSGSYCAGRIFSKEGSWQKRSNNLRYHLPMIVCGSKSSLRFIISLFRPANQLFSLSNHHIN